MVIIYRTPGAWGAGKGSDLDPPEVDANFYELAQEIQALAAKGPAEIESVAVDGANMTFTLTDDTTIGPVALPVIYPTWRGNFTPETAYKRSDLVRAINLSATPPTRGWYAVEIAHTSDIAFDPLRSINGVAVYSLVIPIAHTADIGFYAPGSPGAGVSGSLFVHNVTRPFTLPQSLSGSVARLRVTSQDTLTFEIYKNAVKVGELSFVENTEGVFTFDSEVAFVSGDQFIIAAPIAIDATASDLSITILSYLDV